MAAALARVKRFAGYRLPRHADVCISTMLTWGPVLVCNELAKSRRDRRFELTLTAHEVDWLVAEQFIQESVAIARRYGATPTTTTLLEPAVDSDE